MAAFNLTGRFKEAVSLINTTDPAKFSLFLSRVMRGLLDEANSFTAAEREKLPEALLGGTGGAEQADALVDGCTFIFEQTAYHAFPPGALGEKLLAAGIDQEHAAAFVESWKLSGQAMLERLRSAPLAPLALDAVNWRLHIKLSHGQEESKINTPTAIFQFLLLDQEQKEQKEKSFVVEMNKEELTKFYRQVEHIQDQLDALS